MKKFIYMVTILFVLIITDSVEARQLTRTCKYFYSGYNSNYNEITCTIYDNNSHKCVLHDTLSNRLDNSEKFANSVKNFFKENNQKCFGYIVYTQGGLINKYEIYGYETYQEALEKQTERRKFYDKVYVFSLTSSTDSDGNVTSDEEMTVEEQISEYIEYFKNFDERTGLSKYCNIEDGVYAATKPNKDKLCREQKAAVLNQILKWDNFVKMAINNGDVSEKSDLIKDYNYYRNIAVASLGRTTLGKDDPGNATGEIDIVEEAKKERQTTNGETLKIVQQVYDIIKILIPVLIIALSIIDFLKVILVSDDKNYKSAWDKFIKRLVVGVIFFLVPLIVSFILKYSGIETEQSYLEIFK